MTETTHQPTLRGHVAFRRLWAAQAVSEFGDRITELALPLIAILTLDASPADVGLLTAMVWLPNLASLFIGSWVEHRPRKRSVMVMADLVRAVVVLAIPLAWLLDVLALWQLYAVAALAGLAHVCFITASQPFFVSIVPKANFIEANSKLSTTRSISFIAGPAVGGLLVQILTAPIAMVVDAATFVWSAVFLGRIRSEERPAETESETHLVRRAWEGLRYVVKHPYVGPTLAASTTINFFTFISSALIILFASRTLGLSAGLIGAVFGIAATGGLVGALIAPRVARWIGPGPSSIVGAVLYPLPIALAAFAAGPEWSKIAILAVSEFLSSVGVMLYDINLNSIQASVIPDEIRSRVVGAFITVNYGIRPIGAVVGGLLGTWIGLRPSLIIAAVGGALSVVWLLASPITKVRDIDVLRELSLDEVAGRTLVTDE
jgi:MFS family permease